jgi:thymidylate synthase ThyX
MSSQYHQCLEVDLSRELARIDLPLSTYTYWYWKIDLKNLLHFLNLRLDSHAQWEIRQYAKVIAGIVKEWLPLTWEAFDDYVLNSITLSKQEQQLLYTALHNMQVEDNLSHVTECVKTEHDRMQMSKRESKYFWGKLQALLNDHNQIGPDYSLDLNQTKTAEFFEQQIQQYAEV